MADLFDLTHYDYIFKIILIGDSGVGKSNLVYRFVKNEFESDTMPTIGVDFFAQTVLYQSLHIKAQIWDTAGQERFRVIASNYYKGAKGALIVFDITNRISFDNLSRWVKEFQNTSNGKTFAVVVGNKSDLEKKREVTKTEAIALASTYGYLYIETSALSSFNVVKAFEELVIEIVKAEERKSSNSYKSVIDLNRQSFMLSKDVIKPKKKRKLC